MLLTSQTLCKGLPSQVKCPRLPYEKKTFCQSRLFSNWIEAEDHPSHSLEELLLPETIPFVFSWFDRDSSWIYCFAVKVASSSHSHPVQLSQSHSSFYISLRCADLTNFCPNDLRCSWPVTCSSWSWHQPAPESCLRTLPTYRKKQVVASMYPLPSFLPIGKIYSKLTEHSCGVYFLEEFTLLTGIYYPPECWTTIEVLLISRPEVSPIRGI